MAKALVNSAGKVLLRNGKVATTDSATCCCGPVSPCGTPTTGACVHYINFQFNIDQAEVDFGGESGYLIDLNNYIFWANYDTEEWSFEGPEGTIFTMPFGGAIADMWHDGQFVLTSDGTDVTSHVCIDGTVSDDWVTDGELVGDGPFRLVIGSENPFNAISHHSVRSVQLFSSDPADDTDEHPADDTGFAQIYPSPDGYNTPGTPRVFNETSGSGISFPDITATDALPPTSLVLRHFTTVRIDNDTNESVYIKEYIDPLNYVCCCDDTFPGISSMTLEFTLTGTLSPGTHFAPTCITVNKTFSNTWSRVDADATPAQNEFRLFCETSQLDPANFPPLGIHSADRRAVNFEAGGHVFDLDGLDQGLFMETSVADGGSGVTCENPFSENISEDPSNSLNVRLGIGDFKSFGAEKEDCGMLGFSPHWTAGFVCHNSDFPADCGNAAFGVDVTPTQIAFEDLIGMHIFTDSYSSGGASLSATWTLTVS